MYIFYSNYYVAVIIVCRLLYQNHALENSAKNNNFKSVSLEENESLRNFIKRDTIISPIAEVKETKYLEKRRVNKKIKNLVKKKSSKKKSIKKKPSKMKKKKSSKQTTKKTSKKKKKKPSKRTTKKSLKKTTKKKPKTTKKKKPKTTTRKPKTTKTTTKSTTTTTEPEKFPHLISKVIKEINELRKKHRVPELTVNDTLVEQTRKMFNDLGNYKDDKYIKFFGMLEDIEASYPEYDPFEKWAEGEKRINYDNLNENTVSKEFAQLVWASTKSIGCGYCIVDSNEVITFVCLFYPKGNIQGKYKENVLKP
uniref:SCP domain-containing protein n=1 Tax=Strongyloides venezuelensis TaxID=75913 RepID=A0A0K0FQV0_STRVS